MKQERVNINAPHVVFIADGGEVCFGEKSKGYHRGCKVLANCRNFDEAAAFVQSIKDEVKNL